MNMSNSGINPQDYPAQRSFCQVMIAAGQAISPAVLIRGLHMVAVQRPAGLNAQNIRFEVSANGTDWLPLRDHNDGNIIVSVGADAAHQRIANIMEFEGADFVRIVANVALSSNATFVIVLANV
jgi:hypothetical protein